MFVSLSIGAEMHACACTHPTCSQPDWQRHHPLYVSKPSSGTHLLTSEPRDSTHRQRPHSRRSCSSSTPLLVCLCLHKQCQQICSETRQSFPTVNNAGMQQATTRMDGKIPHKPGFGQTSNSYLRIIINRCFGRALHRFYCPPTKKHSMDGYTVLQQQSI